jgi:hypothetical protein
MSQDSFASNLHGSIGSYQGGVAPSSPHGSQSSYGSFKQINENEPLIVKEVRSLVQVEPHRRLAFEGGGLFFEKRKDKKKKKKKKKKRLLPALTARL